MESDWRFRVAFRPCDDSKPNGYNHLYRDGCFACRLHFRGVSHHLCGELISGRAGLPDNQPLHGPRCFLIRSGRRFIPLVTGQLGKQSLGSKPLRDTNGKHDIHSEYSQYLWRWSRLCFGRVDHADSFGNWRGLDVSWRDHDFEFFGGSELYVVSSSIGCQSICADD